MIRAVADTHAVIWYVFGDARMSASARATIEDAAAAGDQIGLSSVSLAEIVYLLERGRIDPTTLDEVLVLLDRSNTVLLEALSTATLPRRCNISIGRRYPIFLIA